MKQFRVIWKNKDARDHVDLLPVDKFQLESPNKLIEHWSLSPRSRLYVAKCALHVEGREAILDYKEDRLKRWWAGRTKIIFDSKKRNRVKAVLWADEGTESYIDLRPQWTTEDIRQDSGETKRLKRFAYVSSRPGQVAFSSELRNLYNGKCAITGCDIPQSLQAAHIHLIKDSDLSHFTNGILLRSDIHALFDAGLISLSETGEEVELSQMIKKSAHYEFLRSAKVYRPADGAPSLANIQKHRRRFKFNHPAILKRMP